MFEIIEANLPVRFRRNISEVYADAGKQWLADLPEIVRDVAKSWSLVIEKPFPNLSFNFVAPCVSADGTRAVLKIGFPAENSLVLSEAKFLSVVNGSGAVKLLRCDTENCALLLERLSPGKTLQRICATDDDQATEISVQIINQIRCAPPSNAEFPSLESWTSDLQRSEKTGFEQHFAKKARDLFDCLFAASKQKSLLHGDLHHENILSAARAPFLAIDPKGFIGDIGYEISVFLNNPRSWILSHPDQATILKRRIAKFAESFEVEPRNLRQWAFAQSVLAAWWTFSDNGKDWGKWLACARIWEASGI